MTKAKKVSAETKSDKPAPVIAYKGFNDDWFCTPDGVKFQYEVGETYKINGNPQMCQRGFHACEFPLDVFGFYPPTGKLALVEMRGAVSRDSDGTKICRAPPRLMASIPSRERLDIKEKLPHLKGALFSLSNAITTPAETISGKFSTFGQVSPDKTGSNQTCSTLYATENQPKMNKIIRTNEIREELDRRLEWSTRVDSEVNEKLHGGAVIFLKFVPKIVCADGFSMSVQASKFHYCTPRLSNVSWTQVEVGFPSCRAEQFMPYIDGEGSDPTNTVYGYVPIEDVVAVIAAHGGFVD